ncbi:putative peptidase M20 [Paratrimastix pyriformis]|uniref:Peptidase M20 n=1 Tax=Paratrimastix pyriformis TaxID=342808 RepID=A0ABQ8UND9_9EUKA|nr:putative peptidase M20 [Paratrimastix pyriformis]
MTEMLSSSFGLTHTTIQQCLELRHELHLNPSLSFEEKPTVDRIVSFLQAGGVSADQLHRLVGGCGLLAVFGTKKTESPSICFRADIDALPINEMAGIPWASTVPNVSHKCGHDGHTAIMCAVALTLVQHPPQHGQVILCFQPSEERGEGAKLMRSDPGWDPLVGSAPIYGLHNIPGAPLAAVLTRRGVFASASRGLNIRLEGRVAHAATPEKGCSPVLAMTGIIHALLGLPSMSLAFGNACKVTVVHAALGTPDAFGTSPASAVVQATLRTHSNEDMVHLTAQVAHLLPSVPTVHVDSTVMPIMAIRIGSGLAAAHGVTMTHSIVDDFPAQVNDPKGVELVERAARAAGLSTEELATPFAWSEDFSNYPRGTFFGLGAGPTCPPLHDLQYDFPDELIAHGARVFLGILQQQQQQQQQPV